MSTDYNMLAVCLVCKACHNKKKLLLNNMGEFASTVRRNHNIYKNGMYVEEGLFSCGKRHTYMATTVITKLL